MLAKRILVSFLLLPIGLAITFLGGYTFAISIALILILAAIEYIRMFRTGGLRPAGVLIIAGTIALTFGRWLDGMASAPLLLTLVVLASMVYHLLDYEHGNDQAGTDFGVTIAGVLYIGWLGAYFVSLRELPDGLWWFLVALPSVWAADSAAYSVGRRWGRHKLSHRLSPNKSWEGYFGGVLFGMLGGAGLAAAYQMWVIPDGSITWARGALLGLALSLLTTLGDLGESMFKRQFGLKDSGNLLPGHGGVFDRIDSWLWAGAIGYYLIIWMVG